MAQKLLEGLPIIDADRPLVLHITKQDCRGSRRNPAKCAAARAVEREYHHEVRVHLTRLYVKADDGKSWMRYLVGKELRTEIVAFDRGGTFQPGEYVLPQPKAYHSHSRQGTSTGKTHKASPQRRPYHVTGNVRGIAPLEWEP